MLKLVGEAVVMKVNPGDRGGGFVDVVDFGSGSIFNLAVEQINGLKPELKVRLDVEVKNVKGKYGSFLSCKGAISPVKAG